MLLPIYEPQALQCRSRSGTNEGHFTLEPKTVSRAYLASHFNGGTQILYMAFPPHAPQAAQVWSKSSSNEEYFTLGAKNLFVPIAPHIAARDSSFALALPLYEPQPLLVWSKLGSNEGHFTLEAEIIFRPYLAPYCSGVTQTSHAALRLMFQN
jgi:hypothetical protein